ncbi:MAG: FAD-binding oxidoreductase [Acidobacteria bacterium]|nr:FAD-binding oxidoreductase [Acidobacteriota bacterium]
MAVRRSPYWVDRFPKSRRPSYPRFRGDVTTDVVIIGGGLTGAACASAFTTAGVRVVLLEADAIGSGATGAAIGLVREDLDASFHETAAQHGLRAARTLWLGMRRASLDLAAALKRLGINSDVARADLLQVCGRDADAVKALRREYQSRRDAGLEHSFLTGAAVTREAALEGGAAIRTRGFTLDPYRTCLGFAAAAAARGALVHEKSPALRIRFGRKQVDVTTASGAVHANTVIVATSSPIPDLRALRRHLRAEHTYNVVTEPLVAAMRREMGKRAASIRDRESPPHLLRWLREDRILFSGADQSAVPARLRDKTLPQRTGQLMYELSLLYPVISGIEPAWAWDALRYDTADGLPFIGSHRNFPRHLFVMGEGRHGAAVSWLAARVLLRAYQEEPAKGDEVFGFGRIL